MKVGAVVFRVNRDGLGEQRDCGVILFRVERLDAVGLVVHRLREKRDEHEPHIFYFNCSGAGSSRRTSHEAEHLD